MMLKTKTIATIDSSWQTRVQAKVPCTMLKSNSLALRTVTVAYKRNNGQQPKLDFFTTKLQLLNTNSDSDCDSLDSAQRNLLQAVDEM